MKLRKFYAFCTLVVVMVPSGARGEAFTKKLEIPDSFTKTFAESLHHSKLDSGIPYVQRVPDPPSDITRINMILRMNPSELVKKDRILPSFIGSLLAKGSQRYSWQEVNELTEKYAVGLSCYPGFSCSAVYEAIGCTLTVDNEFLDLGLDLFTSTIQQPTFDQEAFEVVKKNSKISMEKSCGSSDVGVLNLTLNKIFYNHNHPYFNTEKQLMRSIDLTTPERVVKAYKKLFNGQRMRLTAMSSLPPKTLVKKLDVLMGRVPGWYVPSAVTDPPKGASKRRVIVEHMDDSSTSSEDLVYLRLKAALPGGHSPQAIGLGFLHSILADDLYENIRVGLGLSYAPHASYSGMDFGLSVISVSTPNPTKTLEIIHQTINSLKTEKKDASYMNRKRPQIITGYYRSFVSPSGVLRRIETNLFYHGNLDLMLNYPKKLSDINGDEIQRLAVEYLKNYKLAFYGKKETLAGINVKDLVIP